MPAIKFEDPFGGIVKKIAVVCNRDHGPGEPLEELLDPFNALGIEVVGRLVEQQHVGPGQQEAAKGNPSFLASRQGSDRSLPGRQAQGIGRDLELMLGIRTAGRKHRLVLCLLLRQLVEIGVGLGISCVDLFELALGLHHFAHALLDRLTDCQTGIELRLLRQVTDTNVGHRNRLAIVFGVFPCHDAEQTGLARSIQSQHTDLGTREKRQ